MQTPQSCAPASLYYCTVCIVIYKSQYTSKCKCRCGMYINLMYKCLCCETGTHHSHWQTVLPLLRLCHWVQTHRVSPMYLSVFLSSVTVCALECGLPSHKHSIPLNNMHNLDLKSSRCSAARRFSPLNVISASSARLCFMPHFYLMCLVLLLSALHTTL